MKNKIFWRKALEKQIKLKQIIKATNNLNNVPTVKYGLEPEYIEKKSLESESFKIEFDFHRLDKVKNNDERLKRFGDKIDQRKNIKLRENLNIGEEVLILAGRKEKRDSPGKFYKSSVENKLYLKKNKLFSIMKRLKIKGIKFFWLKNITTEKCLNKRFQRKEIYLL